MTSTAVWWVTATCLVILAGSVVAENISKSIQQNYLFIWLVQPKELLVHATIRVIDQYGAVNGVINI